MTTKVCSAEYLQPSEAWFERFQQYLQTLQPLDTWPGSLSWQLCGLEALKAAEASRRMKTRFAEPLEQLSKCRKQFLSTNKHHQLGAANRVKKCIELMRWHAPFALSPKTRADYQRAERFLQRWPEAGHHLMELPDSEVVRLAKRLEPEDEEGLARVRRLLRELDYQESQKLLLPLDKL